MKVTRRSLMKSAAIASAACAMNVTAGVAVADEAAAIEIPAFPLPPDIAALPAITAKKWATIAEEPGHSIEGLVFDAEGTLYCTHRYSVGEGDQKVTVSEVLTFSADGEPSVFATKEGAAFNGLAFDVEGALFIADMTGHIWRYDAATEEYAELPSMFDGVQIMPNDIVFGPTGDLYVADFSGNALNPAGGVYRLTAADGFQTVEPFQTGMRTCNGIAFSPDGTQLWVAETSMNRIVRIGVAEDGTAKKGFLDACIIYQGQSAAGPDSTRVDANGNVYQAYMPDGRALVLNAKGIPVANVLVEDRDTGATMMTTCPGIDPSEPKGYLAGYGAGGSFIFTFDALAAGK